MDNIFPHESRRQFDSPITKIKKFKIELLPCGKPLVLMHLEGEVFTFKDLGSIDTTDSPVVISV
ncbi:MAG: hypothetical protein ACYSX1_00110, partial [Planctomycetota bacterium]